MRSTVRTVLFLVITGAFGHAQTFQLKNEPYPPTLAIDPATKTGSTTLQVQNTGSAAATLSLRADDFISTATNHKLGAKITFSDETANAPKSLY